MSEFDPNNPYDQLLYMDVNDLNGFLDVQEYRRTWYDWCIHNNPLTEDIWNTKSEEEQIEISKGRAMIFGSYGGLRLVSRGVASKVFKTVDSIFKSKAKRKAVQARKDADWRDNYPPDAHESERVYLVAPDGSTKVANGQPYGPYTGPYDWINKAGMFGGRFVL